MSFIKALDIFKELPGEKSQKNNDDEIFDALPECFKRAELAPLQSKLMVSEKSINRKLTKWLKEKKLLNPRKGYYEKIGMSHLADDPLYN